MLAIGDTEKPHIFDAQRRPRHALLLGLESGSGSLMRLIKNPYGHSLAAKAEHSQARAHASVCLQSNSGLEYELTGHKWFTSAPMCDGFLTLAQTSNGITCFLVPRWLPNGSRNTGFRVQRLKDKLGDHANASSEVCVHR